MTLTIFDIENLDKVIYKLADNAIENTVPELLNGWQNFPEPNESIDITYRFYESFLIDNNICSIKSDWTENALNGFKYLQLDTNGYYIVHNKKSIKEFIKDEKEKEHLRHINITGDKNIVGDNNTQFADTDINKNKKSLIEIVSWIVGIIIGLIGIYEFVLKHWLHVGN